VADAPICKRCGQQHWRFVRCSNVDGFEGRQPVLEDLPGTTRFGDRMGQYVNMGGNLVLNRPISTGGNVVVPDEWGWDDAA